MEGRSNENTRRGGLHTTGIWPSSDTCSLIDTWQEVQTIQVLTELMTSSLSLSLVDRQRIAFWLVEPLNLFYLALALTGLLILPPPRPRTGLSGCLLACPSQLPLSPTSCSHHGCQVSNCLPVPLPAVLTAHTQLRPFPGGHPGPGLQVLEY